MINKKQIMMQSKEQRPYCIFLKLYICVDRTFEKRENKGCWCSVSQSCLTLCDPVTAACQAPLSITISQNLLRFMAIESVMLSNHLILCHPLLLLPSIFPNIRVFSNESALHIRWPKVGASASVSFLPVNIHGWFSLGLTGLILQSKRLSRIFSSTTFQKHHFFGAKSSL